MHRPARNFTFAEKGAAHPSYESQIETDTRGFTDHMTNGMS